MSYQTMFQGFMDSINKKIYKLPSDCLSIHKSMCMF